MRILSLSFFRDLKQRLPIPFLASIAALLFGLVVQWLSYSVPKGQEHMPHAAYWSSLYILFPVIVLAVALDSSQGPYNPSYLFFYTTTMLRMPEFLGHVTMYILTALEVWVLRTSGAGNPEEWAAEAAAVSAVAGSNVANPLHALDNMADTKHANAPLWETYGFSEDVPFAMDTPSPEEAKAFKEAVATLLAPILKVAVSVTYLCIMQLFFILLSKVVEKMGNAQRYPRFLFFGQLYYYMFWYMLVAATSVDEVAVTLHPTGPGEAGPDYIAVVSNEDDDEYIETSKTDGGTIEARPLGMWQRYGSFLFLLAVMNINTVMGATGWYTGVLQRTSTAFREAAQYIAVMARQKWAAARMKATAVWLWLRGRRRPNLRAPPADVTLDTRGPAQAAGRPSNAVALIVASVSEGAVAAAADAGHDDGSSDREHREAHRTRSFQERSKRPLDPELIKGRSRSVSQPSSVQDVEEEDAALRHSASSELLLELVNTVVVDGDEGVIPQGDALSMSEPPSPQDDPQAAEGLGTGNSGNQQPPTGPSATKRAWLFQLRVMEQDTLADVSCLIIVPLLVSLLALSGDNQSVSRC